MSATGRPHTAPGGERELAPEVITRIVLRPVATSLPLGFRDLPITPDKLLGQGL
jgi:hypothetical protein